jgi:transcriptional regulator with XRE-family HTH domain
MDKDWFRDRLRAANLTTEDVARALRRDRAVVSRILNGRQKPSLEQAQIIADLFGVDVGEVLRRARLLDARSAQTLAPGFSESEAAPWKGQDRADDPNRTIARALGGDRAGVDVWRMKGSAMALGGLLSGDMMLVDTHQADRARAGDVVVAQIYDNRIGHAVTVVRRMEPPVLVASSASPEDWRVHVVDGVNVVVMGRVIASWRSE